MPATDVSATKAIAATAEHVWSIVSDVTRMGEISPETTSCRWIKGATGPTVGAKFEGTNANQGKTWKTVCVVTAATPGREFTFQVDVGPIKVSQWSYTLEATDAGCVVTETWTDRRGWLTAKLGKPLSGVADRSEHNRSGMQATLERLAVLAEQS